MHADHSRMSKKSPKHGYRHAGEISCFVHQNPSCLQYCFTDHFLWLEASKLGFNLRRKGISVPHTDILVSACALRTQSTILHADAHYDMIAQHTRLKVESFTKAAGDIRQ